MELYLICVVVCFVLGYGTREVMSRRRREMQRELSANILQCQPNFSQPWRLAHFVRINGTSPHRVYLPIKHQQSHERRVSMDVNLSAAICGVVMLVAWSSAAIAESGLASVYAYSGGKTASGERANPGGLTAAHRTLKFGTHVRVTNRRNGRSVTVRINDRGPFVRGRVLDITPAGARALGFSGLAPVKVELAQN
jgi:rare lipoprotein A